MINNVKEFVANMSDAEVIQRHKAYIGTRTSQEAIQNASRRILSQTTDNNIFDLRRDYDKACGYVTTEQITIELLQELYDREPLAARIVELMPSESWKVTPNIYETEDDTETAFEKSYKEILQSLQDSKDFIDEDNEGNPLWNYLLRIDILSGIGQFGVLLLGLDDGRELSEPIEGYNEETGIFSDSPQQRKLTYIRVFEQKNITIGPLEDDKTNPRYGFPISYSLNFTSRDQTQATVAATEIGEALDVHWTRVIHIVDNARSNELYGNPRMKTLYNRLIDIKKLYGGSSEMYWQGALPGLSVETHPQLGGDVDIDISTMRDQLEDYMNGLQRYMVTSGMSLNTLSPQVVDPVGHINSQIEAICIYLGCPKRVFTGSERGELASSQDKTSWDERVEKRQKNYLTPKVICPVIQRLIFMGVLAKPVEGYRVKWPKLIETSLETLIEIAKKRVEALSSYIETDAVRLVTERMFLTKFLQFSNEDADAIIEAATEAQDEENLLTIEDLQEESFEKEENRQSEEPDSFSPENKEDEEEQE